MAAFAAPVLSLLLLPAAFAAPQLQRPALQTDDAEACPPIATQGSFNLTEWVRASWFIQQQQINDFQPPENLFCLVATYLLSSMIPSHHVSHSGVSAHGFLLTRCCAASCRYELEGRTVPLFDGTVVSVYNYANAGGVNGPGTPVEQEPLCARLVDPERPSDSIINAPCFLPNALAGPYWVVAAGPSPERYEWGIVSAGAPNVPAPDGSGCSTSEEGINDAGFWLFSRRPIISEQQLEDIRTVARMNGYTLNNLRPVLHMDPATGDLCQYEGARIKPDI